MKHAPAHWNADAMTEIVTGDPGGDLRRITFDTFIEVTDWVALGAASSERIVDEETGEEPMVTWPIPDLQLQAYLGRILHEALRIAGEGAGFRSVVVGNTMVGTQDQTCNFPPLSLPPEPGPGGAPMGQAYPDVFPAED